MHTKTCLFSSVFNVFSLLVILDDNLGRPIFKYDFERNKQPRRKFSHDRIYMIEKHEVTSQTAQRGTVLEVGPETALKVTSW